MKKLILTLVFVFAMVSIVQLSAKTVEEDISDCFGDAISTVEGIETATGLEFTDDLLLKELNAYYAVCWCMETGSSDCF